MAHCSRTRAGPPALTLGRTHRTWGNRHHGPDSLDTGQRPAGSAGAASAGGNLGAPGKVSLAGIRAGLPANKSGEAQATGGEAS